MNRITYGSKVGGFGIVEQRSISTGNLDGTNTTSLDRNNNQGSSISVEMSFNAPTL